MRKLIAIFFMLIGIFSIVEPVFACNPPPSEPKYLDCHDLGAGYKFGFRIDTTRNGTYYFTSRYGTLTGDAPSDSNNFVTISNSNSRTLDWSASLGLDAVIVQAGGKSTVIKMSEVKSGANVHGSADSKGKYNRIDTLNFCYDYELGVTLKAQGKGSSSVAWEITKTTSTVQQDKFAGEKAIFDYTVAVHKTAGDQTGNYVTSTVKVKNNTPLTAKISSIAEVLGPGNLAATLDCGKIKFPYRLYARKELTCTATTPVDTQLEDSKAVVKTSSNVGGGTATAKITWDTASPAPDSVNASTVTVTDTNTAFGGPYVVSGDQSWTYSVELTCPIDPAAYTNGQQTTKLDNTAALTETGQKASQSVQLNCYAPTITHSANVDYDVAYDWAITKTSPTQELTLEVNQTADVDYTVGISLAGQTETNLRLDGAITVSNPNPAAAMNATLANEIVPGVPVTLTNCANPISVPAGGSVTCNYQQEVEGRPAGVSTATLTFNNIYFTAAASYDFQNALKTELDRCVTVYDDAFAAPLGTVCVDQAPATFDYTLTVGPYTQCLKTSTSFLNAASFVANDTGASGYANWEVIIKVPCPADTNCTRTIDYWKSHGDPADRNTYHSNWNKIQPSGPSSPFYTIGLTWYQMIQSDATNKPYVQLAQAYIAAKLNVLYGAAANVEVTAGIAHAEQILAQYATAQGDVVGSIAKDFTDTAAVLDKYNNGRSGPPLCYDCNQH
jgi:hypothetical protein